MKLTIFSQYFVKMKFFKGLKFGRAKIGIFQKMRIKNLRGVSEVRLKKTRLIHLGNVEKPPHEASSATFCAMGV